MGRAAGASDSDPEFAGKGTEGSQGSPRPDPGGLQPPECWTPTRRGPSLARVRHCRATGGALQPCVRPRAWVRLSLPPPAYSPRSSSHRWMVPASGPTPQHSRGWSQGPGRALSSHRYGLAGHPLGHQLFLRPTRPGAAGGDAAGCGEAAAGRHVTSAPGYPRPTVIMAASHPPLRPPHGWSPSPTPPQALGAIRSQTAGGISSHFWGVHSGLTEAPSFPS